MKITVESVFSIQFGRIHFQVIGDLYLNGELMAWIGFMSKTELEAEPGENTIEIFFENAMKEKTKIKFYATKDVHIFVRIVKRNLFSEKFNIETLVKGKDLKIIEES